MGAAKWAEDWFQIEPRTAATHFTYQLCHVFYRDLIVTVIFLSYSPDDMKKKVNLWKMYNLMTQ